MRGARDLRGVAVLPTAAPAKVRQPRRDRRRKLIREGEAAGVVAWFPDPNARPAPPPASAGEMGRTLALAMFRAMTDEQADCALGFLRMLEAVDALLGADSGAAGVARLALAVREMPRGDGGA